MILAIMIVFGAIGIGIMAAIWKWCDKRDRGFTLGLVGGFYWGILLICILIPVLCNHAAIRQMRVFYEVDRVNIERVVERTQSLVNEMDSTEWGIEKLALYQSVSDRLGDLMEKAQKYNRNLAGYQFYKENPFTSWFVPSLKGLEYIKIE